MNENTVYKKIPRPPAALIDLLRGIPVADLHDVMSLIDRRQRLMATSMRRLTPGATIVGPAVTAYNTPGDNLMVHTALYLSESGDVLVVSNGGVPYGALWGSNSTTQAALKGVLGIVIDGPTRDTEQARQYENFSQWSTSVSVGRPTKQGPGSVNVPVMCAGVVVNPGDIVVADDDGVIVIDPADAEEFAAAARKRMRHDEEMQEAIRGGSTLFEQLGCPKLLEQNGIRFTDGDWRTAGPR